MLHLILGGENRVQMVEILRKLLERIAETERAFLKKMRASRKAHRLGRTRPLQDFLAA